MRFNYEQIIQIEEIVSIAKRANLGITMPSELEPSTELEFILSLAGVQAMLDMEKSFGEQAYIVYMNKQGQIVNHFIDGRIEVVMYPS